MGYASIFALLLAAAAPVAQPRPSLPGAGPAATDIAGVMLGMTPAAARAAISASGYRITNEVKTLSFDQKVQDAVAAATGRAALPSSAGTVPQYVEATGPHAERLWVDFASWPAGPVVSFVGISIDLKRQSGEEFLNQVRAKYGAPTVKLGADDYRWCTPGEKQCDFLQNPEQPLIHVTSGMVNKLDLSFGTDQERSLKQTLKDAIDRQVPANRRTAF